jgi:hypothetical protein
MRNGHNMEAILVALITMQTLYCNGVLRAFVQPVFSGKAISMAY